MSHSLTEENDDVTKEFFNELLNQTYERCPRHDFKIKLGDFTANARKAYLVQQSKNLVFMMFCPIIDRDWLILPRQEYLNIHKAIPCA